MKISVVGSGYVGLVTGACLAESGVTVTCVDVDENKIDKLKNGVIPIYEPGLEQIVENNVAKNRLFFTTSLEESLKGAEAVFIAVGTPPDEDGSADLKYVLGVAKEIGQYIEDYTVVITKSTVPIGTAIKVKAAVQESLITRNADIDFDVASNPEFLKEGAAIDDFMKPDRIVIGVESEKSKSILSRVYKPFVMNGHPIIYMDIPSAELTKYTANAMLATKISFMNDIANLCEIVGADIGMVRKGIGSDTRIGNKFIYAGAGYGGSCFPKDVKAIIKTSDEYNHSLEILKSVEDVNDRQKEKIYNKISNHFNGNLKGKRIALWGLSFKPNTDDMREAPALTIISKLKEAGANVVAYDPVAMEEAKRRLGDAIEYVDDQYDALKNADALAIITEWIEFRTPDFNKMESLLNEKIIFDGRNIYDLEEMQEKEWKYYSIGRKAII